MMMSKLTSIVALLLATAVGADYLDSPNVQWTVQIPKSGTLGGRSFKKNNAIVASYNDDTIYATADDGSLHIIQMNKDDSSPNNIVVVEAPQVDGSFAEGRGGVSLHQMGGYVKFAVYAVVLTPDTSSGVDQTEPLMSRVIAVHPNGSIRWSITVAGYAEGTPVVGGDLIYVAHNVFNANTEQYEGAISVIKDNGGGGNAILAAEIIPDDRAKPFGPLTIRTSVADDDDDNGDDYNVLFWGESSEDGMADEGVIYAMYPSDSFVDNDGMGRDSYTLKEFGAWDQSLITKPTVSQDMSGLWVGGKGSMVAGWVDDAGPASNQDRTSPVTAEWESELELSEFNPDQPLFTSMAVSNDNELLYLTDTSFTMICMGAESGDIVWKRDGAEISGYKASPTLVEIEGETPIVYIIEAMTGNIRSHNAISGVFNWQYYCEDRTGVNSCHEGVEAEFSVSSNGNLLYYGDIYGKITAVQVATFPAPAPTVMVTSEPTIAAPVSSAPIAAMPVTQSPVTPSPVTSSPVTLSPVTLNPVTPMPVATIPVDPTNPPTVSSVASPQPTPAPIVAVQPTQNGSSDASPTPADEEEDGRPTSTNQVDSKAVEDDQNDGGDGQVLLFSLITIFAAAAVAALAFFVLIIKKKRRKKATDWNKAKMDAKDDKWEEQQRLHEEECKQKELEMLRDLGVAAPVLAPVPAAVDLKSCLRTPTKAKTLAQLVAVTPLTLASIDEVSNEEASIVTEAPDPIIDIDGDLMSGISGLTGLTYDSHPEEPVNSYEGRVNANGEEEKKDDEIDEVLGYLPKALSSTFDQINETPDATRVRTPSPGLPPSSSTPSSPISPYMNVVTSSSSNPSSPISPYMDRATSPSNPLDSDRPWATVAEGTDDTSSIGSGSLFLDDDGSIKSGRSWIRPASPPDDASEPGIILPKLKPKEDAWTSLMSTIIKAEDEFFNPAAVKRSSPTRPTPKRAKSATISFPFRAEDSPVASPVVAAVPFQEAQPPSKASPDESKLPIAETPFDEQTL